MPDYVSEKIYEGLFAGAVPVYRGARDVGRFMPSNDSYIDANDMTPKELADPFRRLSSDEKEYNRYLAFKDRPLPRARGRCTDVIHTPQHFVPLVHLMP